MTQINHPIDPSQNYLEIISQPLDAMFCPKNVAVIGAKDERGSVGRTIVSNLRQGKLQVFPVNPKRQEVMGIPCYSTILSVPAAVDLAVIATPAKTVPGIIAECISAGVKAAVIISAGFKELGAPGIELEEEIKRLISKTPMPIIGPNCLGIMNPISGLNATFAKGVATKGNVAFISQSGALCTAVLDWSFQENIGFSAFVSVGSMIDVNWGDLIRYFGQDPNTHSILLYMETFGDPRSFLSAAREVALQKPIVVIKPGRTLAAAKAAASHTGSLVGDDAVCEAAFERVGVLRVETIAELFDMAQVLAKQPLPKGPNLGIITNAGGPAVLATDAAIDNGAKISTLTEKTQKELNAFLPKAWSHSNPVDILGDASAETYEKTMKILIDAEEFDGILTILTPQDMTESFETAESLKKFTSEKPILASWMGAKAVEEGVISLNKGGICTYEFPDEAAAAFAKMWHHHENLKALYEVPEATESILPHSFELQEKRKKDAEKFFVKEGRILSEEESKAVLSIYGIPVVNTVKAKTAEDAKAFAKKLGFPVVLKLLSSTITHKSDVGGVVLNLNSEKDVEAAFYAIKSRISSEDFDGVTVQNMVSFDGVELIFGSSIDPQFGPVILFGGGGEMVEIYQDTALALPPLGSINAKHLIEKTKIFKALKGFRGKKAVDWEKLIQVLVNFSKMIVENPWIKECDINPLLAGSEGIVALDARIITGEKKPARAALRSYPFQYLSVKKLKNEKSVILRPVKADDIKLLEAFHQELSEHTVHQRYLKFLSLSERVARERLSRICLNDYTNEFTVVAELVEERRVAGVARLSRIPATWNASLFMVIDDAFQRQGLGMALMEKMKEIAEKEGIKKIFAQILSENTGMILLCKRLGFQMKEKGKFIFAEL